MKFQEFNLHENVLKGIEKAGFTEVMPVQEKAIKESLKGKDIGVQSHTGSGKTAAFLIPILQYYSEVDKDKRKKTLIVAPTRELVVQIEKEIHILGSFVDMIAGSFFGGVGYGKQETLIKNNVDVIIGTPGRLIDFGKSGKINFHDFGHIVIDEADRMFDMGFYSDITKMMRMMLPPKERKTMLFSATLSTKVMNLAWEFMNEPVSIEIEAENITVNEISQVLYHVSTSDKMPLLLGILQKENPGSAIIFTNTKYAAVELTERLKANGYDAHYIMGDLPQRKRLAVIEKVKSGKIKFLVATDVAARGLHVDDLEMVVNYDIPEDFENYVHRIGRTARAGKSGKAVTFACEKYVYGLEAIEKYINMKIPVDWPEKELFLVDKSAGRNFYREKEAAVKSSVKKPYDNRKRVPGRSSDRQRRSGNTKFKSVPRNDNRKNKPIKRNQNSKINTVPQKPSNFKNSRPAKPIKVQRAKVIPKLTRNSTEAEKLAYYKNKYGENFKLKSTDDSVKTSKSGKKKSIFKKLFSSGKKKG